MSASRSLAEVLVVAGTAIAVASSLGALLPRRPLSRVHFLSPVTSVAAPLVGVGLALDAGWEPASATILFTVLVVTVTGPVLAAATARAYAERRGLVTPESLE
ncbi:monovalent cation/H(+) antiporter subunit G [Streptosporangium amethystogenes]|uniref:monovalent cation/H(+) antiporter subunit G n=1 Tax=Streptosporangium amethystogenes TaxID=2002 RepID=UPI00379F6D84